MKKYFLCFIFLMAFRPDACSAANETEAINKLGEAVVKQFKLDDIGQQLVDTQIKPRVDAMMDPKLQVALFYIAQSVNSQGVHFSFKYTF